MTDSRDESVFRPGSDADRSVSTAAPHPEEMSASVELRIGNSVHVRATARVTPAGLVAAALLAAAITLPIVWLVRSRRSA